MNTPLTLTYTFFGGSDRKYSPSISGGELLAAVAAAFNGSDVRVHDFATQPDIPFEAVYSSISVADHVERDQRLARKAIIVPTWPGFRGHPSRLVILGGILKTGEDDPFSLDAIETVITAILQAVDVYNGETELPICNVGIELAWITIRSGIPVEEQANAMRRAYDRYQASRRH